MWWLGLDANIERLAQACVNCQSVKQATPVAPLIPWSWPAKSREGVHVDFAGTFQNKMYLLAVDAHSKWPEVLEMTRTTITVTFANYGIPQQIVSDNGPQFHQGSLKKKWYQAHKMFTISPLLEWSCGAPSSHIRRGNESW